MITVACVRRSGGPFTPIWVQRLQYGVRRHLPLPHRFVCFSDVDVPGVETIPYNRDWPRWWPKQVMFGHPWRDDEQVMSLDLDSIVTGDLSPFFDLTGDLYLLRDFNVPGMLTSTLLLWRGRTLQPVWDAFIANPTAAIENHPKRMDRFIAKHVPPAPWLQDVMPGAIVCAKAFRHVQPRCPRLGRILFTWGAPRFDELEPGHWLRDMWEGQS